MSIRRGGDDRDSLVVEAVCLIDVFQEHDRARLDVVKIGIEVTEDFALAPFFKESRDDQLTIQILIETVSSKIMA